MHWAAIMLSVFVLSATAQFADAQSGQSEGSTWLCKVRLIFDWPCPTEEITDAPQPAAALPPYTPQTPPTPTAPTVAPSVPAPIERVVERVVEVSGITEAMLESRIAALRTELLARIPADSGIVVSSSHGYVTQQQFERQIEALGRSFESLSSSQSSSNASSGTATGEYLELTGGSISGDLDITGSLGIGTSDPLTPLHVEGDIMFLADDQGYLGNFNGTGPTNMYVGTNIKNVGGTPTQVDTSASTWMIGMGPAGDAFRLFRMPAGTSFGATAPVMNIDSTGRTAFGGTWSPAARLEIYGGMSAASWSTSGVAFRQGVGTYTDTSGSGTIAHRAVSSIDTPTLASSNSVTLTNASTLYIANAPLAGTNTTITNRHALFVAAGTSTFLGAVGIGTSTPWRSFSVSGRVALQGLTGSTGAGSLCLTSGNELVYNSASDSCLSSTRATKHSIGPLTIDAIEQVVALQPVSFTYNSGGRERFGFIAEDAAAVDPHLATYDESGAISGIDDRAMLAVVTEAIREIWDFITQKSASQDAEIEALRAEVDALKAHLNYQASTGVPHEPEPEPESDPQSDPAEGIAESDEESEPVEEEFIVEAVEEESQQVIPVEE